MKKNQLKGLPRFWGVGRAYDEKALADLINEMDKQGIDRRFESILPNESDRLRAVSVRQHHEATWAEDFRFPDAYISFLDSIVAAFIYDPEAISVPANFPIKMFSWYRNVLAFNNAMTPDLLKAPLPRHEFWKRGFTKIAQEIFTDRVITHQTDAQLAVFTGSLISDPKVQRVYPTADSITAKISDYLFDNWVADGYFDFNKTGELVNLLYGKKTVLITKQEMSGAVNAAVTASIAHPYLTRIEIQKRIRGKTSPQNIKHILNNGIRSTADVLMRHLFLTPSGELDLT